MHATNNHHNTTHKQGKENLCVYVLSFFIFLVSFFDAIFFRMKTLHLHNMVFAHLVGFDNKWLLKNCQGNKLGGRDVLTTV